MVAARRSSARSNVSEPESRFSISRWKGHVLRGRVAGLIETRHPGQKPFVITPALHAKVLKCDSPHATGRIDALVVS